MSTSFRTAKKIIAMEKELADKLWYERHMASHQNGDHCGGPLADGDCRPAERIRDKYGIENLGPYDGYDWGMLNGKLSALRWVMGEDWDMLDT